ncbi:hypothetical protein I215_12343 [Galbibacter marinus]|uniref:Uncharacterized protein n=2 Tax=Galbibacter marinus TaxID=555500 RepID=K2PSB9_9FLAO|nr:hypothetical protein I215_12343 [Galbibacter marinus]
MANLLLKIDQMDAAYVDKVSDQIYEQQPFFLSVLLGYSKDISMVEVEEIMKVYFLIWEYFKLNQNLPKKKITQTMFEKAQQKIIQMLHYSEGEPESLRDQIYEVEFQNLKSKSLWAAVLFRFHNRPALMNLNSENKGIILVGILSFIQCFEAQ